MTTTEFSTAFDTLYNNITSNQAPGLNDYEKSIFLTKAQSQLVNEYFSEFDTTRRRQYDFSSLINVQPLTAVSTDKYDPRAFAFKLPDDWFLMLNEAVIVDEKIKYIVKPISFNTYDKLMSKPYKLPAKGLVWRLITNYNIIELIGDLPNSFIYRVRYVKKPTPIILENLSPYNVSIEGSTGVSNCGLPQEAHQEILERAVTLAKITWQGGTMTQAAMAASNKK